jgi:hypothetical protein
VNATPKPGSAKTAQDLYDARGSGLYGLAKQIGITALTPTFSEKDGYGDIRKDLLRLGSLAVKRAKDPMPGDATGATTVSPFGWSRLTLWEPEAAAENVEWLPIANRLGVETDAAAKFLAPGTGATSATEAAANFRLQARDLTEKWISEDPKDHLATATSLVSTTALNAPDAIVAVQVTAKALKDLEKRRAQAPGRNER